MREKKVIYECYLRPRFGHMPLDEITTAEVARFRAYLIALEKPRVIPKAGAELTKRLGEKRINNILAVLSKALKHAVDAEVLAKAPKIGMFKVERTCAQGWREDAGRPGAPRSSEFHAWGDSNLYLRRHGEQLTLSVEHRAAAAISTVLLQLDTADDAVALAAIDRAPPSSPAQHPPKPRSNNASSNNSRAPTRRSRRPRSASAARSAT
jgi:hypothetical protein